MKLRGKDVELNVTEHCNLRCAACNHASPHLPQRFVDVDEYRRDLKCLAAVFTAERFKLVGGEPLLHPRLADLVAIAKESGLADEVVIMTNGLLLDRMPEAVWELVDAICWSVYPNVNYRFAPEELFELAARHSVNLSIQDVNTFELAFVNKRIDDEELVERIFRECKNKDLYSCHTIHHGRYYKCSPAPFVQARLELSGVAVETRERDGVRLIDNPALREELERYLGSNQPLAACRYCLGTSGPQIDHRQLRFDERAAELAEDHSAVIAATRLRLLSR